MLKVNNTALAAAMARAASIVESRNTMPILAMVRLTAESDKLTVTTSNLDIEYRQTIECFASETIDVCVDAKRLAQMSSAANSDIAITLEGNSLIVKAGRSKWTAPTLGAETFPSIAFDCGSSIEIDGEELSAIISRTIWASSKEETRYYLRGVFFNAGTFVATDGHCLSMVETDHKWSMPDVIAPASFLKAVQASVGGDCSLGWDDRKMRFACGDTVIIGKMIDGQYPDYRRIIPEPCEPWATNVSDLAGAIKRVRISSDAQTKELRIKRGDGMVTLRIEGTSGFEGEEDVIADCSEGMETAVNADYISAMLASIGSDGVTVEQRTEAHAFVFRPTSQDPGLKFTGIVMGMRI